MVRIPLLFGRLLRLSRPLFCEIVASQDRHHRIEEEDINFRGLVLVIILSHRLVFRSSLYNVHHELVEGLSYISHEVGCLRLSRILTVILRKFKELFCIKFLFCGFFLLFSRHSDLEFNI